MSSDSTSDSISVKGAADRLQDALRQLETSLRPLQDRLKTLEKSAGNAEAFEEDRARLARELDDAKAREQEAIARDAEYKAREAEFSQLAEETMREMDMVINQVKQTLGRG